MRYPALEYQPDTAVDKLSLARACPGNTGQQADPERPRARSPLPPLTHDPPYQPGSLAREFREGRIQLDPESVATELSRDLERCPRSHERIEDEAGSRWHPTPARHDRSGLRRVPEVGHATLGPSPGPLASGADLLGSRRQNRPTNQRLGKRRDVTADLASGWEHPGVAGVLTQQMAAASLQCHASEPVGVDI